MFPAVLSDYYLIIFISLQADFIRCHVGMHKKMLPVAVLAFFVYTVGFPAVVFLILRSGKKLAMEDQVLRAQGRGDNPTLVPRCYDFRSKFSVLYFRVSSLWEMRACAY